MTECLYDTDSYCREFSASVLSCVPTGGYYGIVLDKTAFFPEGGGQASDTGMIEQARITDVQWDGDTVLHYADKPLPVGSAVTGWIDWEQRFFRMQKHTGEHIVSGLIHRLYGLSNVGFHLGSEDVTMDFDGELTREQLDRVEDLANAAVWDNVPVTVSYPSEDELAVLPYRSKKALAYPVRIVTVTGYDVCACCAPHVAHTGEIGVIKLLDAIRYKGGMRVHMQSGADALRDYRQRYAQTAAVAKQLSSKQENIAEAVLRIKEQRDELDGELHNVRLALALAHAQAAPVDSATAYLLEDQPLSANAMREVATALSRRAGGIGVVFCTTDGHGYTYTATGADGLTAFVHRMNEALQGHGGGKGEFLQGRVAVSADAIRAFFGY